MNGPEPRRALILAGGGLKVAFQAGVLEVWLDEAGLDFDLADGCSGGAFNLAMWVQGMSGRQIADNWRHYEPIDTIGINWRSLWKLAWAESLLTFENLKSRSFEAWGLDFEAIRRSEREASFNAYNFSRHRLETFDPSAMTADHLCACVALPMWFPPVRLPNAASLSTGDRPSESGVVAPRETDTYIDSVFLSDANLEEAIQRGAEELWVIWTVSEESAWRDGLVHQYFQIIETVANGRFRELCRRIEDNNAAIESGEPGEFRRHIELKILRHEVDSLHYLLNTDQDRFAEAVDQGVEAARRWCAEQGIDLPVHDAQSAAPTLLSRGDDADDRDGVALRFTETMRGYGTMGVDSASRGYGRGRRDGNKLSATLTVEIDDVDRFVRDAAHPAMASGVVRFDALDEGAEIPVRDGRVNLVVDAGDPRRRYMYYRLHFEHGDQPLTLVGLKIMQDDPGWDLWSDTTTLRCYILQGFVEPDLIEVLDGRSLGESLDPDQIVAAGEIRIEIMDFLRQLTTFRLDSRGDASEIRALGQFGQFFLGRLWDVYARDLLPQSPL